MKKFSLFATVLFSLFFVSCKKDKCISCSVIQQSPNYFEIQEKIYCGNDEIEEIKRIGSNRRVVEIQNMWGNAIVVAETYSCDYQ